MNRQETLKIAQETTHPYDVIIVGGGATGLGAAVDAASRGYSTLLVEQADFAKGTSSKSTKLVHGGVRYLKQGDVRLVLDALKERGLMLQNAPHLVHDLKFVIPGYNRWDKIFYGMGMKVYDAMAGKRSFGSSHVISRDGVVERIPTIETKGLRGGVVYHDGQFDDSRLAVNLAQTAHEHGAHILSYVRCKGLLKKGGRICGIRAVDEESGETFEVEGNAVVNATGVYVDDLLAFDSEKQSHLVAVSQGIHLVLPKRFLPGNHALMVPKTADGRVLFAIPWHGHVVVGTTDTPLEEKSLEPRALEEERDFVMSHARKYLADDPKDEDVLSIFAGLRPLVRSGSQSNTSRLSRDHTILVSKSGLVTVTGGKWTTYRKMGEDVINHAETVSGMSHNPSQTVNLRIHGWSDAPDESNPFAVYGSDAPKLRQLIEESSANGEPVHPSLDLLQGEVRWHARHEMARTVEDVLARRSRALLLDAAASREAASVVAEILADELNKDTAWQSRQVALYRELAQRYVYSEAASVAHVNC
jgi:glycerol-3-phosphate dehydrogenase